MGLREGDSLAYLRLREQMIDSDCNAIFQRGNTLSVEPVLLYQDKFVVEREYQFFECEGLPGFTRYELKPEEKAKQEQEAERIVTENQKPRNFHELQAQAQANARRVMADRYSQNRAQRGLEADDVALAQANRQHAAIVAAHKGQRH